MKWIKRIWGSSNTLPPVNGHLPMPKVKPPRVDGVSEPVYTFITFYLANKKRFTTDVRMSIPRYEVYDLKDNVTGDEWRLRVSRSLFEDKVFFHGYPEWMTLSEIEYVYNHLVKPEIERAHERKTKVNAWRKAKRDKHERARLLSVYSNA